MWKEVQRTREKVLSSRLISSSHVSHPRQSVSKSYSSHSKTIAPSTIHHNVLRPIRAKLCQNRQHITSNTLSEVKNHTIKASFPPSNALCKL